MRLNAANSGNLLARNDLKIGGFPRVVKASHFGKQGGFSLQNVFALLCEFSAVFEPVLRNEWCLLDVLSLLY